MANTKAKSAGAAKGSAETFRFQTEVQQLLELIIHSLYSHKEIFLRELVSNASDALDRLRFEALTHPELLAEGTELRIRIETDEKARTLTVHDNGIGMNRKELVDNIGTIAKSGTRELVEKLEKGKSAENVGELIGQFGVGFYSSFMVAEKVELVTRRAGQKVATRWESDGKGAYRISRAERTSPGTSITLHLKPVDEEQGLEDFTDFHVVSRIVRRYSDFIAYPIVMKKPAEEGKAEGEPEEVTLNSMKPIWERPSKDVTGEEYAEFYKHVSHDWNDPLEVIQQRAEGLIEYKALVFVPSEAPYDLYFVGSEPGLRLYVRRVQIMENCQELLPRYLRFLRGVVDSPDLPLNVSREILQHDRQIRQIRKGLLKKVLDTFQEMKKEREEAYLKLWKEFGRCLKEGVAEDFENKDRLVELLLFESSRVEEKLTSLDEYVSRMKEGQENVYYLTGDSRSTIEASPHLEAFRARDIEVLYLTDPIDEILVQSLPEYRDKKLQSVGKGTVDLGDEKKEELDAKQKELSPVLEAIQKALDDRVKEVRLSTRLTTSPACLVGADQDFSPRLERFLRKDSKSPMSRRILELNPEHEIVRKLKELVEANGGEGGSDEGAGAVADYAELLYGYSLLAEGSEIPEPAKLAQRVAELMARGLKAGGG